MRLTMYVKSCHYFCSKLNDMKVLTTVSLFFILFNKSFAQTSGTISYTETMKLEINLEGGMAPPPGMPTEMTNKTTLYYNDKISLYKNDEAAQNEKTSEQAESGDGNHFMFRMAPPDNQVYCDFEKKTITRKEDFMQRQFLIESELNAEGWKMTGKQKMILNYPCMEAVKQDSVDKKTIWFTSAIPITGGPGKFVGLPGMVLEVNINEGERIITATLISPELDAEKIVKPKDGKKVTEEEFDEIVDEKMKEMGIEGQEGGPRVIIHIKED